MKYCRFVLIFIIVGFSFLSTSCFTLLGFIETSRKDEYEARQGIYHDNEYYYKKNGNTFTITNYFGTSTDVVIPQKFKGRQIDSIGKDAFKGKKLTSVIIPDGVISIGVSAFASNRLTSIVIPDSVKYLSGFDNNILSSVTIPNGVTSIGVSAFASNQLTSIVIPNSVTSIAVSAFARNKLTSVTIQQGVTRIDREVFRDNQLTTIIIPDSVTGIGDNAFANNQLTSVVIPDSVRSLAGFSNNKLSSVTIPNGVTGIGGFANNQLTSVVIPDSVTEIRDGAFANNQLISVTIPKGVTKVGASAFGTLTGPLNAYRRLPGIYTAQGTNWYRNGELLQVTTLLEGKGVDIIRIDGEPSQQYVSARITEGISYCIPPGRHTVEVNYYAYDFFVTTRSVGSVSFEHRYLFEGSSYLFTGKVQGDQILFGIVPQ